jgi:hypothetical protein
MYMYDPNNELNKLTEGANPWEFMDTELNKPYDEKAENGGYKSCLTCCGGC